MKAPHGERGVVMCSCCGEPWSKHASNHQPGCSGGVPMFVANERVGTSVANDVPSLARRFSIGGRR